MKSVKKMHNNERKRKHAYYCRECGYRSDRRFNIERHAKRIHSRSITKKCCNILFFKKSDYYHHIEDYHPNMRSSCFVSKKKYKIYGRKLKFSTGFSYKTKFENTVNSSNISDECTAMRRSMRIHERVVKRGKQSLKETSTESEFDEYNNDDMDVDYNNYDGHEELIHDLYNYQRMNSLSLVSEEHENSRYEESENNVKENLNTVCQLPLKKRILCEINNNVKKNSILNDKEIKIKQTSFNDKENQNPIDIFLMENQSATIVKQILTVEQAIPMWNNITQHQRDYLRYIDFNLF